MTRRPKDSKQAAHHTAPINHEEISSTPRRRGMPQTKLKNFNKLTSNISGMKVSATADPVITAAFVRNLREE